MDKLTATNSSNNAFSRGVDSASGSMHRAIDSASDAASPAIKQMSNSAHNTVNKMAHGAIHAAEVISDKGEQLHQLQQQFSKNTRNQVRSHPLLSISIAVAGGMLFSWWLSRRRSGHDAS